MRLDNLSKCRSLRLLFEDEANMPPLEPGRYPPVRRHMLAAHTAAPDIDLEELEAMAFAYPPKGHEDGYDTPENYQTAVKEYRRCQKAFEKLMDYQQANAISGLRGSDDYYRLANKANTSAETKSKFGGKDAYLVIAADVDEMKHLNESGLGHRGVNSILKYIGQLFAESFDIENTKVFHPHGDEFRVISYIGPDRDGRELTEEQTKVRFIKMLQGCMEVANKLASTGFYQEGWDDSKRIQPTISLGISTTDTAADGILTHVKSGASSGKPMKYAITIDRDLRYDLGFNPEDINQWLNTVKKVPGQIVAVDPSEVVAYDGDAAFSNGLLPYGESRNILGIAIVEDKLPMDEVRERQGAVVLECSWSEIPEGRRKGLNAIREEKRGYLSSESPKGVMRVGKRLVPLKEPFKP